MMRAFCFCIIGANLTLMFVQGSGDPLAATLLVISAYLLGRTHKRTST